METLTLDIQDGSAIVMLNRPDVLNSINTKLIGEMRETVATIAADRDARVVLMTGAGRGFCAGADLAEQGSRGADMSVGHRAWLMA